MQLKPFNAKKTIFTIIILCVLTVLVYQTYYFFQLNNLVNDRVVETSKLTIFLDNEKSNTFPGKTDGYIFDRAECSEGATGSWDDSTWSFITSNLTKTTECNIYFERMKYTVTYYCGEACLGVYIDQVSNPNTYKILDFHELFGINAEELLYIGCGLYWDEHWFEHNKVYLSGEIIKITDNLVLEPSFGYMSC